MSPKVSVILPTYNQAHLLGRSATSVFNQTYRDFELIFVDDGSTDNTEDVIRAFDDPRIRYLKHIKNMGLAAARNTGIKAARGEYIAFQDSDDEWCPDKLKRQMEIFDKNIQGLCLVYTDTIVVRLNGKKEVWHMPRILPRNGFVYNKALNLFWIQKMCPSTFLVVKDALVEIGGFDERLLCDQDTEALMRMSKKGLFYHIRVPLAVRYEIKGSLSRDLLKKVNSYRIILEKHYTDISKNRWILAKYHYEIGILYLKLKNKEKAKEHLLEAFKNNVLCVFGLYNSYLKKEIKSILRKLVHKIYLRISGKGRDGVGRGNKGEI
ncbi:MAG: glycosyltransferase [Candidatus Saganbacteria bacterium]|nr:glycosyltransferase [Candidatus Saganbacteria bacterium]